MILGAQKRDTSSSISREAVAPAALRAQALWGSGISGLLAIVSGSSQEPSTLTAVELMPSVSYVALPPLQLCPGHGFQPSLPHDSRS